MINKSLQNAWLENVKTVLIGVTTQWANFTLVLTHKRREYSRKFSRVFQGLRKMFGKKKTGTVSFSSWKIVPLKCSGWRKKANRTLTPQLNRINFSMTLFCTEGDLVNLNVVTYKRLSDRDVVVDIVTVSTLNSWGMHCWILSDDKCSINTSCCTRKVLIDSHFLPTDGSRKLLTS